LLLGLVAAACLALSPLSTTTGSDRLRPPLDPPLDHTIFLPEVLRSQWQVTESSFGIHANFLSPTVVDEASRLGTSWFRVPLFWSSIEPQNTTPEQYQWNPFFDAQIALLTSRGIRPILLLYANPGWAATYGMGPIDRVDIGELVQFMQAAVAHYSVPPYNVKHWEIYNEIDNTDAAYADTGWWGYFGHQPEVYLQELAAIYGPMKAVDPQAQIVLGALAYDGWTTDDPPGIFAPDFLDRFLAAGGGAYFDVMNFHYYLAFRARWEPYGTDIIGKTTALRQKLAAYGLQKPIFCTETSMWSDAAHGGSDELQSRYVAQVFARSRAAGLNATIWFQMFDPVDPWVWSYGLMTADVRPKPAYTAYQTLTRQLAGAEYVRSPEPTETGCATLEAYEFRQGGSSPPTLLAWSTGEQSCTAVLAADEVLAVDKYGATVLIRDGEDGRVDRRVQVTLGPSPVYLHPRP
jgi:hypothetical protein